MNDLLGRRLKRLGLRDVDRILTHTNRTVMVSLARRVLRLHRGYASAPDRVLRAIVRFLDPRIPRAVRRGAGRVSPATPEVAAAHYLSASLQEASCGGHRVGAAAISRIAGAAAAGSAGAACGSGWAAPRSCSC